MHYYTNIAQYVIVSDILKFLVKGSKPGKQCITLHLNHNHDAPLEAINHVRLPEFAVTRAVVGHGLQMHGDQEQENNQIGVTLNALMSLIIIGF